VAGAGRDKKTFRAPWQGVGRQKRTAQRPFLSPLSCLWQKRDSSLLPTPSYLFCEWSRKSTTKNLLLPPLLPSLFLLTRSWRTPTERRTTLHPRSCRNRGAGGVAERTPPSPLFFPLPPPSTIASTMRRALQASPSAFRYLHRSGLT